MFFKTYLIDVTFMFRDLEKKAADIYRFIKTEFNNSMAFIGWNINVEQPRGWPDLDIALWESKVDTV